MKLGLASEHLLLYDDYKGFAGDIMASLTKRSVHQTGNASKAPGIEERFMSLTNLRNFSSSSGVNLHH
jgi:hypothetical protein